MDSGVQCQLDNDHIGSIQNGQVLLVFSFPEYLTRELHNDSCRQPFYSPQSAAENSMQFHVTPCPSPEHTWRKPLGQRRFDHLKLTWTGYPQLSMDHGLFGNSGTRPPAQFVILSHSIQPHLRGQAP